MLWSEAAYPASANPPIQTTGTVHPYLVAFQSAQIGTDAIPSQTQVCFLLDYNFTSSKTYVWYSLL
jgi:hypothetical protein